MTKVSREEAVELLLELALECEQATGPDRELDQAIELALPGRLPHPDTLWPSYATDEWAYVISGPGHPDYEPGQGYISAYYTRSIDAAVMLVPEGWSKHIDDSDDGDAALVELYNQDAVIPPNTRWGAYGSVFSRAPTWPLGLCAAALRARAAMEAGK